MIFPVQFIQCTLDFLHFKTYDIEVIVDTFTVQDRYDYFAYYSYSLTSTGELTISLQNHFLERINQDLYVSTDGDDTNTGLSPNSTLQSITVALQRIDSDSLNPKSIFIQAGTYSKELNNQKFPLGGKRFVNLVGEDVSNTIIYNDYSTMSYLGFYDKGDNQLENLQFLSDDQIMDFNLGFWKSDNVILRNIIVQETICNHSYSGAVYFYRSYNILLENTIIRNNVSDMVSGLCFDGGNLTMINCILDNNDSIGNSQYISNFYCKVDDYLKLDNCIFSNSDIPPVPDEEHCTIQISEQENCSPEIEISNCLFSDNYTPYGSFIARISSSGSIKINNSSFTQNTSHICPLGIVGIVELNNTILYNNESDYDYEINTGSSYINSILNISNCDIEGGEIAIYPGNPPNLATINWLEGNIDEDPIFLLSGEHPYQITEYSPCIDAGTQDTTGLFIPPWDLLHNQRIWDGDNNGSAIIDMGCYEFGADSVNVKQYKIPFVEFNLSNYPNPFNPETTISFSILIESKVKLYVYNIRGQKLKTLINDYLEAGQHSIIWQGTDNSNKPVSSGVYFYSLQVNDQTSNLKKMLLLK
ncbi:T9SS type A sorting domain-containing protein [Candidatus Cloacimonadota bacterium]